VVVQQCLQERPSALQGNRRAGLRPSSVVWMKRTTMQRVQMPTERLCQARQ
jgi:hypothetical protein